MTLIPVNPNDYPTEFEPLDEGVVYDVVCRSFEIAPKLDKNDDKYLTAVIEVLEPEMFRGRKIFENYIGIPKELDPDMSAGERYAALNSGIKFSQFCKCFNVQSTVDGLDTSSALGQMGKVSVKNGEYQGRKQSRVKDYLF